MIPRAVAILAAVLACWVRLDVTALAASPRLPQESVTFAQPVAGILHHHCAPCHRDGQAAPFRLITYADARKHAREIAEVVEQRTMPPWLAEPGYGHFANERRLSESDVHRLLQWVRDGAPEGDPRLVPEPPQWPTGWGLGKPDLVVAMDRAFPLGAEGPDLYRNFVFRAASDRDRWVRAIEFVPGNPRVVHHAFIRIDHDGGTRLLDGRDGLPGFKDMVTTARMPGGHFLTWNPGGGPVESPPGLAWKLPRGSDLVVEMHLNRSGKPETVQSSIGLYFTESPPTNTSQVVKLTSYALHFPPGETNLLVRDSMTLPVDVSVLALYPHAHFLCREMKGYATLPDGTREWLLWIKRWDFNWQTTYRFATPVPLPKGAMLHLEYRYDNSTNNPANPHHPPRRVGYGQESTDEMCELGFQVLTRHPDDQALLERTFALHRGDRVKEGLQHRLRFDPNDAEALTRLGMILWQEGKPASAREHLDHAAQARPDLPEVHYNRGVFLRFTGQFAEARDALTTALRLDPAYPKGHQQLAFTLSSLGRLADAERAFAAALANDPTDTEARDGLAELRAIRQARQRAKSSSPAGAAETATSPPTAPTTPAPRPKPRRAHRSTPPHTNRRDRRRKSVIPVRARATASLPASRAVPAKPPLRPGFAA